MIKLHSGIWFRMFWKFEFHGEPRPWSYLQRYVTNIIISSAISWFWLQSYISIDENLFLMNRSESLLCDGILREAKPALG